MNTESEHGPHANTRTEGRVPVWGSELTRKAAKIQGDSVQFSPILCVVGLGPVVSRARVLVREVIYRGVVRRRYLAVMAGPLP